MEKFCNLHAALNETSPMAGSAGDSQYDTGCAFERSRNMGTLNFLQASHVLSRVNCFDMATTFRIPLRLPPKYQQGRWRTMMWAATGLSEVLSVA